MTLEAFAARHPTLWRLSPRGSADGIRRHGLLSAATLAARAGVTLPTGRRRRAMPFALPDGTPVQVTDNSPLSEAKLARVLDDGLTPADWIAMLNARVFFWPDRRLGAGNLRARRRFGYVDEWHRFDTAAVLAPAWDRAEIAPFNTGATLHTPPRRGHATFAPLDGLDLAEWRERRRRAGAVQGRDAVREVTVRGDLPEAASALIGVEHA
ncbi:DUF7002 family protein [Jannaschia ovalis]|uniref:Uncharacterized protein n=1 Tax=Jannaschia ovalis TaxID=3038773 RepID=A0ABY8LAE3_9RHOB|nr:hypothetical protein [Jannaschia sp. GRR-S6-38]WGH77235.1 hypothetical protein P8627_09230 [Jannaschia sp. GRR-S6-38]